MDAADAARQEEGDGGGGPWPWATRTWQNFSMPSRISRMWPPEVGSAGTATAPASRDGGATPIVPATAAPSIAGAPPAAAATGDEAEMNDAEAEAKKAEESSKPPARKRAKKAGDNEGNKPYERETDAGDAEMMKSEEAFAKSSSGAAPSKVGAKKGRWAKPPMAKVGEKQMPAGEKIAIIVPSTHYAPRGDRLTTITKDGYLREANEATKVIEAKESTKANKVGIQDFDVVRECIRNLLCMAPPGVSPLLGPPAGHIGDVPAEQFFHPSESSGGDEVELHPLHVSLAIFVAHLALALEIDKTRVADRFFFVTSEQLEEASNLNSQEISVIHAVFRQCPIYVLHGDRTKKSFDAAGDVIHCSWPYLTYPPAQSVATPVTYPLSQESLLRRVWNAIPEIKEGPWRPRCIQDIGPRQLGECLQIAEGDVNPKDRCKSYLVGYYRGAEGAKYTNMPGYEPPGGNQGDAETSRDWVYDFVWLNGTRPEAAVHYWGSDHGSTTFDEHFCSVSLSSSRSTESYERADEVIVYPLPPSAFPGRDVPAFGRLFFVNVTKDHKGPQLIHLEFPPPGCPIRRTEWWFPPKRKGKSKGKDKQPKVPYLRDLCNVIANELPASSCANKTQVFRVDFVYSTLKPCFYPLAVMGLPALPDTSGTLPLRVHMETAHAAAHFITAHFINEVSWPG